MFLGFDAAAPISAGGNLLQGYGAVIIDGFFPIAVNRGVRTYLKKSGCIRKGSGNIGKNKVASAEGGGCLAGHIGVGQRVHF